MIICIILFQLMILLNVKAQNSVKTSVPNDPADSQTNFQPSLVVVIGILAILFSLTLFLLIYAKFCHSRSSILNTSLQQIPNVFLGSMRRSSGIDKTVIESLPFFRFSALKGSREGLECAVCLARFEDFEILRLLPRCKHAFHIDCIDRWLERHSSCPLCRHKVDSADDLTSNESHFLSMWDTSTTSTRQDSGRNLELYVQREESSRYDSSSSSSRWKLEKFKKEEQLPIIRQQEQLHQQEEKQKQNPVMHNLNHRIITSDVVLKNRWSNVSSSDLIALNSELISDLTTHRFSSLDNTINTNNANDHHHHHQIDEQGNLMKKIKEEIERKRLFEIKIKQKAASSTENGTNFITQNEKRSMSEIVMHPRFRDNINNADSNLQECSSDLSDGRNVNNNERRRNIWLPIARRTAQWFAKRERRSADQSHYSRQSLNT